MTPILPRARSSSLGGTSRTASIMLRAVACLFWACCADVIAASGDLDASFVPQNVLVEGVHATALSSEGKVLIGGWMTATNASDQEIQGLVQLDDHGALDDAFGVPGTTTMVSALSVGSDDSIVCAGIQTNGLNAVVRRLLPNGSLDPTLDIEVKATISPWIYAITHQTDGRLLVAGAFNRAGGLPRTNLFRLHTDGTLDTSFKTNFSSGGGILALALQTDGKILIGGYFTNVLGTSRRGVARLNLDGSLDTSFNPGSGVQGIVKAIRVEADGRILIGGPFYSVNGLLRSGLARLSTTGTVDPVFNAGAGAALDDSNAPTAGPSIDAIVIQGDGRIVVGGDFDHFDGLARRNLARLHWDGEVDEEFDPGDGPNAPIRSLALDADGNLLAGGDFTQIGEVARPGIARLASDGALPVLPTILTAPSHQTAIVGRSTAFSVEATGTPPLRYQWLKGGLPISGQTNQTLRISNAQFADDGRYSVVVGNPAGEVTSVSANLSVGAAPVAPTIVNQPSGVMVMPGESVTFTASATGTKPLAWQWNLGGIPIATATTDSLVLDSVTTSDAGNYTAKVSNAGGFATTSAASLTVFQPQENLTAWAGSNVTMQVKVFGPGPFGYQWWYEGSPVTGANKSTLTLTNLKLSFAGEYFVVLSNAASRATSPPAMLVVNMKPLIAEHPVSVDANAGTTTVLSVSAEGSEPLTYQWRLEGTDLPGQTNDTLSLGPLLSSHAGRYSVSVANPFGTVQSRTAIVTVQGEQVAQLTVDSAQGFSGENLEIPLWLLGVGNENTVAFSLEFDPEILTFTAVSNGIAVGTDASLIVNSADAAKGRLGFLMAQPPSSTFKVGSNHLATLHFQAVAGLASAHTSTIHFGDQPVPRSLLSSSVRPLFVTFEPGTISLEAGYEADLSPSPNGDQQLSVEDWSLVAQMVAGLVKPASESEFARADCAPAETLGDGILAASDWTQAGRYAAGIDSPQPTGGPTGAAASLSLQDEHPPAEDVFENDGADPAPDPITPRLRRLASTRNPRHLLASNLRVPASTVASVPIQLSAAGDENTAGFTVLFDPAKVQFRRAYRGTHLGEDSILILNTNQTARGRLGVLLARPVGTRFSSGFHEVLRLELAMLGNLPATISFGDSVVRREVVTSSARVVSVDYLSGQITPEAPAQPAVPRLPVRTRSGSMVLRWDASLPGRYTLETSIDLVQWTILNEWNVSTPATLEYQDPTPVQWGQRFFRVR